MPTPPRSTLVVGGPAYYTPEGYEAPRQPVQSFMPTDTRPDPIGDQFRRVNPPPPAQTAPPPTPPPPPVPAPTPAPAPVEEPVPDIPAGAYPPYIPGVTPFPGIPGLGDVDFSGLPGMGNIDIDAIIKEYQDRQDAGEPEPFDSFLPPPPPPPAPEPKTAYEIAMAEYSPTGMSNEQLKISMDAGMAIPKADYPDFETYLASLSAPVSTPEPEFVPPPTMPEPNGFFPGVTPDFSNLDFSGLSDLNLEDMDFSNLPVPPPPPPPRIPVIEDMDFTNMPDFSNVPGIQNIDFSGLPQYQMPAPTMPAPQAQAPAPVYTPPPSQIPMQGMMDDYDFGNPNLRNMGRSGPRR